MQSWLLTCLSDRSSNVAIAVITRFAGGLYAGFVALVDAWTDLDKVDNDACPSDDQEQVDEQEQRQRDGKLGRGYGCGR